MVDISKAPFSWEDRPSTITWIDRLDGPLAVRQCALWGLLPAPTLEENRVILKNHLRGAAAADTPPPPYPPPPVRPATHTPPPTPRRQNAPAQPQPQPEWLRVVEATAQAIGTQIAAALAQNPIAVPQPQANPGILPRAVIDAVKGMPECSGGDSHVLLDFLIACEKLLDLDLADNRQLLIAILPRTSGRVRTTWAQAIADNTLLHDLCQDLAEIFIPDPTRHQLISDAVFRRQAQGETLTDFITSVQDAARVLLPQGTDLLETILAKINSSTRARLAGLRPAETLDQLLQLAPLLEVIRVTEVEERREVRDNAPTPHQYNTHFRHRGYQHTAPLRRTYYNTAYRDADTRARAHPDTRHYHYNDNRAPHSYRRDNATYYNTAYRDGDTRARAHPDTRPSQEPRIPPREDSHNRTPHSYRRGNDNRSSNYNRGR